MNQQEFYEKRMIALGVTEENNTIQIYNPEIEPPISKVSDEKIFWYDQAGNITINYWDVEGTALVYYRDELKNPKPERYMTKRLQEPRGDMKYQMPRGQGTKPWFHPKTVEKFKQKEKIETLYLTEGVFKAFKAGECGLDVVGLASITCYAGPDKQLHHDIVRLMEVCDVDNLVILWDGDCLNVSHKDIKVREEATRRPFGFFTTAKNIRKLTLKAQWTKTRSNPRIFFMHIKSHTLKGEPKGLDDMLIVAEKIGKIKQVVNDLKKVGDKHLYFHEIEITSTTEVMFKYFCLDRKDATKFYQRHAQVIGDTEFFFRGDMYQYNDADNKLVMLQPEWAKSIFWVGDEFFEEIVMPSAKENFDKKSLEHRKKGTLSDRFGRSFTKFLKYYHGFVNIPNHFHYDRIIEKHGKEFLNQYFPFPHVPEQGRWDNIEFFIKHIFGENEVEHPKTGELIPNWHLGLDYLQLLLLNPTQPLPIIVLFSQENQTGKSTFGELCYKMLGDNVIFIGNQDLQSDFNEVYAGRLLAICEETLLERRKDAERIKNMSTATRLTVNPKGQKQYTIDFFTKFQFYSNNPRMVYVTRHDDRYWILKVKAIPKDKIDPTLKPRMWEEIPAFVHYLKNREMATKTESRMHFNPDLLRTETFQRTVKINEPTAASDLREYIKDMFLDLHHDMKDKQDTIEMPLQNIKDEFFTKGTSSTWVQEILRDYLQVDLLRDEKGQAIYKRGSYKKLWFNEYAEDGDGAVEEKVIRWKGRPYVFNYSDFIDEEIGESTPEPAQQEIPWEA